MTNIAFQLLCSFHILHGIVKLNRCHAKLLTTVDCSEIRFLSPFAALHHMRLCMRTQVFSLLKLNDLISHIQMIMLNHPYNAVVKNTDYFSNPKSHAAQDYTKMMHARWADFELKQHFSQ